MVERVIKGRGRFRGCPVVEICDPIGNQVFFKLDRAEIVTRSRDGEFAIQALHDNGTDLEHDSAYVATFDGAGLTFKTQLGRSVIFTGVLLDARYYLDQDTLDGTQTDICDSDYYHESTNWPKGHLIMPFQPPKRRFNPGIYEIRLVYGDDNER